MASSSSLYNIFHGDYIGNVTEIDTYHGEFDDDSYGSLYIPHIEEHNAYFDVLQRTFEKSNIGTVTFSSFVEQQVPLSYMGKSKNYKPIFSAIVYLKWHSGEEASIFRRNVLNGDNRKSRINFNNSSDVYLVARPNTTMSDELFDERTHIKQLEETGLNSVHSLLCDEE
jgi:hypothetical protein